MTPASSSVAADFDLSEFSKGTIRDVQRGAGDELVLRVSSPSGDWRLGTEGSPWELRSEFDALLADYKSPEETASRLLAGSSIANLRIDQPHLGLVLTLKDGNRLRVAGRDQPGVDLAMLPCWRVTAPSLRRMILADPLEGLVERDPHLPAYLTWPAFLELQIQLLERRDATLGRVLLAVIVLMAVLAVAAIGAPAPRGPV